MAKRGTRPRVYVPPTSKAAGRRVWLFFALAYLISWSWLIPLIDGQLIRQGHGWPTHLPALMGPMLAAGIVTMVAYGTSGLRDLGRRMVRWRVGWVWWLAAVSPVLMLPIALLIARISGSSPPSVREFSLFTGVWSGVGLIGVLAALVVGGFGEETGWRGFAVPHLEQSRSPLTAALIIAPMWALWHLPQFVVVANLRTFTPVTIVGWFLGLTCGSIVLTWLYDGSGGSILLVSIWHALFNVVAGTAAAHGTLGALVTMLIMVQAVALVVHYVRKPRRLTKRPRTTTACTEPVDAPTSTLSHS